MSREILNAEVACVPLKDDATVPFVAVRRSGQSLPVVSVYLPEEDTIAAEPRRVMVAGLLADHFRLKYHDLLHLGIEIDSIDLDLRYSVLLRLFLSELRF